MLDCQEEQEARTRPEQEVPEAEAPAVEPAEPKRKRHVFQDGICRACQQRDRVRMGFIATAQADLATPLPGSGGCFAACGRFVLTLRHLHFPDLSFEAKMFRTCW